MSDFVYRFRTIEKLLEHKELETQSIYFSPPHSLNDPIENYKDIFWYGDEILWTNLLKNYLLCLQDINILIRLKGIDQTTTADEIPVFTTYDALPTQIYKDKMKKIFDEFFGHEKIKSLIKGLSNRKNIRRNELLFYLETIHVFCLNLINKHDQTIKDSNKSNIDPNLLLNGNILEEGFFDLINQEITKFNDECNIEDVFFSITQKTTHQQKILNVLKAGKLEEGRKFYCYDFPQHYVRQIEQLMFWPWYTACFSNIPNNSSMWGYYTDGHKGVCLKFKTTIHEGRRGIFLKTTTGYGGSKNGITKHYGQVFFELHNINYEAKVRPIDFFKFIGRLPYPALINQWYSDENKNMSPLIKDVINGQEEWRTNYWKTFYSNIPIKTQEWKHEEEARLIHISILSGDIAHEDRILNYNFNDLEGVIFGLNTTDEHKVEVIKIVHDLCIKNNRSDFNFYQASYNNRSGKIDINKVDLLQLTK